MFISNAKSTFSFASKFSVFFVSETELFTVRNATARFFVDGEELDAVCSVDGRRFGEFFAFTDCCLDGVAFALLSLNGTFDILLMPSFLLRFCAFSKNFYNLHQMKWCCNE